ncbi:hypothetical protein Ae168Ps1_6192c [Pseudonocardia sp. Ae168_Ps1]|nr:hypothetical protein Ae168Ps1_6192c [Pseudonocardia sp. Ae168_Ps1]OLL71564.1 hypothetical protein Ae263Ps1_6052c [Pseudonocardia sp. Ae263_Ps1]
MLQILAGQHPRRLTRAQLAPLAGIAVKGGTYSSYLSALRTRGYLTETDGLLGLTAQGRDVAGPAEPLSTEQVRQQWRSQLRLGARTMLDALIARHPMPVSRAELAAAAELTESGGTFSTYLSTLRRNGLARTHGDLVHATDVLFPSPDVTDRHQPVGTE